MTETQAGREDVVDILASDHRDMLELIAQIEAAPDPAHRRDLADAVTAEIMRHAVAEEMFVYPAVKEHVPNGEDEVAHDKEEHDEIVKLLKRMEDVDAAAPEFMQHVRELESVLSHHARDEETDQFPKLRAAIPHEKLIELGEKVQNAKKLAPTRPHPSAPHAELFHKTVGPGVGMVDRMLDKLQGRNQH